MVSIAVACGVVCHIAHDDVGPPAERLFEFLRSVILHKILLHEDNAGELVNG